MKKYIIIAGVPRAGKSTISKKIAKEKGYQHISMDSILAGIEKIFPETNIHTGAPGNVMDKFRFISSKVAPFISAMMDSGEYEECDYGVVIDVYQLTPHDFVTHITEERAEVYFVITPDITPEERFRILKEFDTPKDYTYFHSDEENRDDCASIVEISNWLKSQCVKYKLPYIDTTYNRENKIQEFIDALE